MHGQNIRRGVVDQVRRIDESKFKQLAHGDCGHYIIRQLVCEYEAKGRFKAVMIEYAGVNVTGQQRFSLDN